MRNDPLQQYAKLRRQLLEEKTKLEARLNEISQVLGSEGIQTRPAATVQTQESPSKPKARRRRRYGARNTITMREAILEALSDRPLSRKELLKAVQAIGFRFTTKNPLNSISSVLYAKGTPIKKTLEGKFYVESGAPAGKGGVSETAGDSPTLKRKRRKLSPEGRARIAAAARARWARQRAAK
jgi:hypothetical protein